MFSEPRTQYILDPCDVAIQRPQEISNSSGGRSIDKEMQKKRRSFVTFAKMPTSLWLFLCVFGLRKSSDLEEIFPSMVIVTLCSPMSLEVKEVPFCTQPPHSGALGLLASSYQPHRPYWWGELWDNNPKRPTYLLLSGKLPGSWQPWHLRGKVQHEETKPSDESWWQPLDFSTLLSCSLGLSLGRLLGIKFSSKASPFNFRVWVCRLQKTA